MTTAHFLRRLIPALAAGAMILPSPVSAQRFGAAIGYSSMPGRLGELESDHGPALRLGADLTSGSRLRFGLEAGVERQNEVRRQTSGSCFLPGGGTGPCFFDITRRDVAWSLSGLVRVQGKGSRVRPYGLLGVGFIRIRTREKSVVTDAEGNRLPNFEIDATFNDDALPLHLGAGVLVRPAGLPVWISVEGRANYLIHNYSGGLQANWNPSISLGVRWGG